MYSATYKVYRTFVFFLLALSITTLACASGLSLCTSDNNKIHFITDSYKISQWPWTFDFQEDLKLATKMSESERHELLLKLSGTIPPDIKECWNINAAALTDHYPRIQNLIANSTAQNDTIPTIQVFTHELAHYDTNPGNRLAMRRGYIVGLVSLALINQLSPQYAYIGWVVLGTCFIFPDYADKAFDEIHRIATTPMINQGQHSWGQGRLSGYSEPGAAEPEINYGSSSSTVFSGQKEDKNSGIIKKGNIHGFGP